MNIEFQVEVCICKGGGVCFIYVRRVVLNNSLLSLRVNKTEEEITNLSLVFYFLLSEQRRGDFLRGGAVENISFCVNDRKVTLVIHLYRNHCTDFT